MILAITLGLMIISSAICHIVENRHKANPVFWGGIRNRSWLRLGPCG